MTAFGRTGVLSATRGPTPPEVEAFGASGVLEAERGSTPLQDYPNKGMRWAGSLDDDVAAFLESHDDAVSHAGRILCTSTGHEMPPKLSILEAHWAGKRYRSAVAVVRSGKVVKRSKMAYPLGSDDEDRGVPLQAPLPQKYCRPSKASHEGKAPITTRKVFAADGTIDRDEWANRWTLVRPRGCIAQYMRPQSPCRAHPRARMPSPTGSLTDR